MPHAGDAANEERYGMDSGGDGVSKEELDAFYEYKASKEAEVEAQKAAMAAQRAKLAKQNATDFETVPDFVDRRKSHMSSLNDHNYAEPLTKEKAVFAFNSMSHGPMAEFLDKQAASPPKSPNQMAPRGRTRAADDFFGTNLLLSQSPGGNPFEMRR